MANIFGLPSAAAWQTFAKDPQAQLDQFAKDKTTKAATDYFKKNIGKVKTVDDLFKDRKLAEYVLKAYDLSDELQRAGRLKRMLTEDPTKSDALVNRMTDARFKAMAKDLRLDTKNGLDNLDTPTTMRKIEGQFVQAEFERKLGVQDPALREALYFARKADDVTNVYNVLGDKVLRSVVTATLNLPQSLAIQPVETQARAVEARIKIADFSKGINTSNISASQKARAESDIKVLEKNLQIGDATIAALKPLKTQLGKLLDDYATLPSTTDANGQNAATIALQQNAVPELLNQEQMLDKNKTAITSINTQISNMGSILDKLRNPAQSANFTSLKAEFTTAFNSFNSALNGANFVATDGTSINGLLHSSDDVWLVQPENDSDRISVNRFNLSNVANFVTEANNFVQSATTASDAGLLQAQSRVLLAGDKTTATAATINTNRTNFDSSLKQVAVFASTLNTTSLGLGARSADDALSRVSLIKTKLADIKTLAQKSSAATTSSTDRASLQTQFETLRTDINALVSTTGAAGLDNFLNNQPTTSYNISSGHNLSVVGDHDLASQISAVLNAGDIANISSASSMVTTATVATFDASFAEKSLTNSSGILQRAYKTYDPQGKLDAQVFDLQKNIGSLINNAKKNDANLLDPAQSDITLNVASQNGVVKLRAQTSFKADYTSALQNAASAVGTSNNAAQNAVLAIKDVLDNSLRQVGGDQANVNFEFAKTGSLLDSLKTKEDTATGANATYKTNSYTYKFISRFLLLNGSSNFGGNISASSKNASALSLFDNSQNRLSNISSLSIQV